MSRIDLFKQHEYIKLISLVIEKFPEIQKEVIKCFQNQNDLLFEDEEPEDDDEEFWEDIEDDDEDFNSNEENNETELPEVCSCYRGWDIWVEKDDAHKFKITAVLENDDEYEIDSITIYGDEIDEDTDVDTFVTDRIDEREDERAEARDWNENYASYMGLDEDPDWNESNDPDW